VGDAGGTSIHRINPRTKRVVRRVKTGRAAPEWLAAQGYSVWAANKLDRSVARIDERKNRRVAPIKRVGNYPVDLGIVAGSLWVPTQRSNTISRVDLRRNRVLETVQVGAAPLVGPDHPDELWVGSFGGRDIWRLKPG
jgi:DNA-binding beta-propeller fold protein YncE